MFRALVLALFALTVIAAPAGAAAPAGWTSLSDDLAKPMVDLQTADGRFPDTVQFGVPPRAARPSPVLGYALIEAGLRGGDRAQVRAGLKTLNQSIVSLQRERGPGAFDHFAIASAYNVARTRLTDEPLFADHRADWEDWLRRVRLSHLPKRSHYANKYLVEAVAVLELSRSGLRSSVRGSALAKIDESRRLAQRLVNHAAPKAAARAATRVAGGPAYVLSDPSNNSLPYHALSLGFYGRAVELMGPAASARARRTLHGVARASWALTGPDGDLAYVGRSQALSWTLSLSAAGAERATASAGEWAPRFSAVSDAALRRLRSRYGIGPWGPYVTPSRLLSGKDGPALDAYATGPTYIGLTLIGVNWAIDAAERRERTTGRLASELPGVRRLASGRTAMLTGRRGKSWYAIRRSPSSRGRDLRYDFGLVALKRPGPRGEWIDVLRQRPRTSGRPDSAGPVLHVGGRKAIPEAHRSLIDKRSGKVTLVGGWRVPGRGWVRRGVRFAFTPVGCGLRITVPRRPGDRMTYSVFTQRELRGRRGKLATKGFKRGHGATIRAVPAPAFKKSRHGPVSATDDPLLRTDLRFRGGRGPLRITLCDP